jgi:hypothetical protein
MTENALFRCRSILLTTALLALMTMVQPCNADESISLGQALSSGDGGIDFRLRYEFVNADDVSNNSNALTLRSALSYRTQKWKGFDFFLEAVNVTAADDASYSTGPGPYSNGITDRPVVPDPELTLFTQVILGFESFGTRMQLGTQEINLDDQRFIGAVGWRQNHQRFESFRLSNNSVSKATFNVVAMSRVQRVTGANQAMTTFLLNGKYDFSKVAALSLYAYLLDFVDQSLWGASTSTIGGRLTGNIPAGAFSVPYEAQFAHQADMATNPDTVNQNYAHLMAGLTRWGVTLKLGYEMLGGNDSDGQFNTTLATLHKFNGWADRFLVTPKSGLQDFYSNLGGSYGRFRWAAIYHNFKAESIDSQYGDEWDLLVGYKAPWGMDFFAKSAFYQADTHLANMDRFWTWITYSF